MDKVVNVLQILLLINWKGDNIMNAVHIKKQDPSQYINTINWLNDKQIQKTFGITKGVNLKEHIDWLSKHPNIEFMSIMYKDSHIGNIILDFNERHRSVFLQIYIGDFSYQGRGIGTQAMNAVLNYIFDEKKMNRVHLKVFEDNVAAISLYEKLGFIKEGMERESHLLDEVYRNQLLYSILSSERKRVN